MAESFPLGWRLLRRFLDVFRRGIEKLPIQPERIARGAPFVMTLEGNLYSDLSGRVTDIALAGGAREVVAAGRMVATQGRNSGDHE